SGIAGVDSGANQRLTQDRQQDVVVLAARDGLPRDANRVRCIPLEQILVRSSQISDVGAGSRLAREIEVALRHVEAVQSSKEDSALVVEAGRFGEFLQSCIDNLQPKVVVLLVEAGVGHKRVEFFAFGA